MGEMEGSEGRDKRRLKSALGVTRHGTHVSCPVCRTRKLYRLADGRRKCGRCGKKFTPRKQQRKIPRQTLKELVRLFWLMVPAERAARDLGINRKTALRHYTRLRIVLLEECRAETAPMAGEVEVDESYFGGYRKGIRGRGAAGKIPVFGLLKRQGLVHVVFPAKLDRTTLHREIQQHVMPQSWVYSDGYAAYDKLDLKGVHHVRIDHGKTLGKGRTHINGIENFWGFAKRRLKMYHGGWKKNFRLFLKELEFRFNHRDDLAVLDSLVRKALASSN